MALPRYRGGHDGIRHPNGYILGEARAGQPMGLSDDDYITCDRISNRPGIPKPTSTNLCRTDAYCRRQQVRLAVVFL